ncbi:MAG: amino acid permease [Solobacterium sp.]|nr:amino acid permease [Solobacterium sp.]
MNKPTRDRHSYLTVLGAWALAFGCSVGWGAFVMPGTTFLPVAGPLGTAIGLGIGGLMMLVLALIYHYLMNRFPDGGGTYTYTREMYSYDHGFISAWFLILTYGAILWANATALPLIARTLFGSLFQFGFDYEVAGFHCYMGEILLAEASLVIGALLCMRKKAAEITQILMALLMMVGVAAMVAMIAVNGVGAQALYSPDASPEEGIFTIFALAPWAYVGFESISHSAGEAKFSMKKSFSVFTAALVCAALAYIMLTCLAVSAQPPGISSWPEYISRLGEFSGVEGNPTFYAAQRAYGSSGALFLGVLALCGIFTGLIGNYIALSRLLAVLSEDGLLSRWVGRKNERDIPANAILLILMISMVLPFFGRVAISWIVDVTTVGATIAYALTAMAGFRLAKKEQNKLYMFVSGFGLLVSLMFAIDFLVPNITSVKTLSTESYLILAAWGILGFLVFRTILKHDKKRRFGHSIVAWVVLLGLIIFTSSVWLRQSAERSIENTIKPISEYYLGVLEESGVDITTNSTKPAYEYTREVLREVDHTLFVSTFIQTSLIVAALLVLFDIYSMMQKREKQMEIEKALAEESSRAKTSFLSNMSHEIRTPMNAIIGLDNIALRDPDISPRTREYLEKIGASAKHLLGLINDILDMSRIESGRMVLKNEEFSFRETLDQINIIINGQCVDKGLTYQCNIIGHISDYYYGDDMKLKQVLINILGNSVKFTDPPGTVTLTVEQTALYEGYATLRFVMKDTGIGMDPEFIPKIFEAFSQEDSTSTNRYGGSGLGMAITKNLVEMMNGDIKVESKKGVGSTFTVTVTLKASERTAKVETHAAMPENLRAFVLDDDFIACEHAQVILRGYGIRTDISADPNQSLKQLKQAYESGSPYLLVLTDYRMPDMSGLEFIRRLREFDHGESVVIVTTGYNWDMLENEGDMSIVDGILSKPLYSESLMRTIHSAFAKKSGLQEPEIPREETSGFDLAGRRILMAEDVEQNAEILEDLLQLEDMEAEHARNGEEAVRMFCEHEKGYYDAILMDVRMPVMDGLTATRTIRALEREDARQIPIIAMTANVFDEDVERSLQSGMDAHLSKPVEPDHLYEVLQKLIASADRKQPAE